MAGVENIIQGEVIGMHMDHVLIGDLSSSRVIVLRQDPTAVNGGDGCQDTTGYQMSWDCIRETKQRAPECICHGACTRGPLFVNVCTCPHDSQACCCSAKNVTRLG